MHSCVYIYIAKHAAPPKHDFLIEVRGSLDHLPVNLLYSAISCTCTGRDISCALSFMVQDNESIDPTQFFYQYCTMDAFMGG